MGQPRGHPAAADPRDQRHPLRWCDPRMSSPSALPVAASAPPAPAVLPVSEPRPVSQEKGADPRQTMQGLPRFLQPYLTFVTGAPLPGEKPLVHWTPTMAG